MTEPLLSELSRPGGAATSLPAAPARCRRGDLPAELLRAELRLPELGELDVVRHFTHLSQRNYSIDTGFYPLGSCTMKYNPKVNEDVARLPGFAHVHPLPARRDRPGRAAVMFELQQPAGGDHRLRGRHAAAGRRRPGRAGRHADDPRVPPGRAATRSARKVLVPDSAHGTNPATAAMCGFDTVSIPTDARGNVDLAKLQGASWTTTIVGLMLTNPNTLGLFEEQMLRGHRRRPRGRRAGLRRRRQPERHPGRRQAGRHGLRLPAHQRAQDVFARRTAAAARARPGRRSRARSSRSCPRPVVVQRRRRQLRARLRSAQESSAGCKGFQGHFGVLARGYTYIRMHGADGLRSSAKRRS